MDTATEFQNALRELMQGNKLPAIVPAKVTSVNTQDRTCDVMVLDEYEIFDVRLRAIVDSDPTHLLVTPATGSQVLIACIGDQREYVVIACSQLQSLECIVGQTTLQIDAAGMEISRAGINLSQQINDLITQIQAITVPVPALGTSGPPLNAAALEPIRAQINQILK